MILNFQQRFVPYILEGSKTHTIRAPRKHEPHVGEICHCFTGLRRKGAKLLGRWPCVKVERITIAWVRNGPRRPAEIEVAINGQRLEADELNALAWRDGFREGPRDQAFERMMAYWDGQLPFVGHVIHWRVDG
jgi:hypothetical protein